VNHKIRVPQVRCIDDQGEMVGVVPTREAMSLAIKKGLDLVEVSPNADPPVCRIMDFGKYRYTESMKRKQQRKHQQRQVVKEIKFHASVAEHDYQTKVNHIRDFLAKGHKVKVTLAFRGRENAHRELGFELIKRVVEACEDIGVVDMEPRLMGRSIICLLGAKAPKAAQK
jgi:translation initiation factor IF-3